MNPNPLIGVLFHWLGGLSSASFYVPYRRIRGWSWEIFWLTGGLFSWLIAPWLVAWLQTRHLLDVLGSIDLKTLFWCWFWGALWGLGGLSFGLTMRYLGLSLGMAIALGLTTIIGTLGPPLFHGTLGALSATANGKVTLFGIAITIIGIVVVALAGRAKEREATRSGETAIAEFDLRKGFFIALFSGVMSGCFAWGLDAGQPIRTASLAAGTPPLWQGLPVLCVVLSGGLTTNVIWCAILIRSNRSAGQWLRTGTTSLMGGCLLFNYALAALGGTLWYLQFFFYTMGESQMGRYAFSSWSLHMASIILFSTLWGFALREWAGSSARTRALIWTGIGLLVSSTVVIGIGNYLSMRVGP
ncbi:MAG TPA: L-rhamnose/proton symporter RhaT [Steroidobacteraceae bacterium]